MRDTPEDNEPIKTPVPDRRRGLDGVSDAIQELAIATRGIQEQHSHTDRIRQRQTKLVSALIVFLILLTMLLVYLLYVDIREGDDRAIQNTISRVIDTEGKVCEISVAQQNLSTESAIADSFEQCLRVRVEAKLNAVGLGGVHVPLFDD